MMEKVFSSPTVEKDALRDSLLGALIGLSRATQGNTRPGESTWLALLEGLLALEGEVPEGTAAALLDRLHGEKEKLVPGCSSCAHPCGRNNDAEVNRLREAEPEVLLLKDRLLAALGSLAQSLLPFPEAEGCRFVGDALFLLGEDVETAVLRPVTEDAGRKSLQG